MNSKSLFFLCLISFFLVENVFGQSDIRYKECLQRGYEVEGNNCLFPNGTSCNIDSFNSGTCGQEFMALDYCVKENQVTWDTNVCCEGLVYYMKDELSGKAICAKNSTVITDSLFTWEIFLIVLIPIILLFLLKMQARNTTNRINRR